MYLAEKSIRCSCLAALFFALLAASCPSAPGPGPAGNPTIPAGNSGTDASVEQELIAAVDHFLYVAGNYDLEGMAATITDNANIGVTRLRDGVWESSTTTFTEYFEHAKTRKLEPYYEPVRSYELISSEGQLAAVKADAILHRYGIPRSSNVDFFTFLKENDEWKILNVSFTGKALAETDRVYDIEKFAKGYAQAWGSKRKDFVASFFGENGTLELNSGASATGRKAIAELAQGFIDDLPDMVVTMNKLEKTEDGYEFYWNLAATHAATGKQVDVNGYEEWEMDADGLIAHSTGHFPSEEYQRQLESD